MHELPHLGLLLQQLPASSVWGLRFKVYRATSLIRNTPLLRPYSRTMPRKVSSPPRRVGQGGRGASLGRVRHSRKQVMHVHTRNHLQDLHHIRESLHHLQGARERWIIHCRTSSASAAHATHCATFCTPCQPLLRAFSGWIRSPPPSQGARGETPNVVAGEGGGCVPSGRGGGGVRFGYFTRGNDSFMSTLIRERVPVH